MTSGRDDGLTIDNCDFDSSSVTEDSEKGKVPDRFPGTLRVSDWDMKDKEEKVLHPDYRAYGSADNPEFYYFVTRILASVNARNNNFNGNTKGTEHLLSKIFTVEDEAFALLMLYNELHVWESALRKKKDPSLKLEQKRFCDAKSGRRDGWAPEGKVLYRKLCAEIKELRQDPKTGEAFEKQMRERFREECRRKNGRAVVPTSSEARVDVTMMDDIYVCERFRHLSDTTVQCARDNLITGTVGSVLEQV